MFDFDGTYYTKRAIGGGRWCVSPRGRYWRTFYIDCEGTWHRMGEHHTWYEATEYLYGREY